ncbi:MAG: hypothetical protein H9901_04955 [Candidatus Paralactobacillus gallistercoris]|uniref:Uncharacterized protein n=1 Tax=Candidatus Paralactobacillus gallistercoris TaxID=2838724 RepID=A0A948WZW5_9LACO|nr:hypothetical protein [Candidatus Paralactobacillus gallistercoris]
MKEASRTTINVTLKKRCKDSGSWHMTITNWKQDRSIEVIKNGATFVLREKGHQHLQKKNLNRQKVMALVQKQIDVEFPGSHKMYLEIN